MPVLRPTARARIPAVCALLASLTAAAPLGASFDPHPRPGTPATARPAPVPPGAAFRPGLRPLPPARPAAAPSRVGTRPPPWLSLRQSEGPHRLPSRCFAGCFDGVAAYATPAYYSLDQARSVSLHYSSIQAAPVASVFVEVWDVDPQDQTPPPDFMYVSMSVRDDRTGAWVATTEGYTNGAVLIGATWDVSQLPTGAYPYTVFVTTSGAWAGSEATATIPTRVIVVNERANPAGAGWSIGGLQRLHVQSDGVLATGGDGSAVFFTKNADGSYTGPVSEFTRLWFDGSNFHRRYPDGTEYFYMPDGRAWFIRDRWGNQTTFEYTGALLTAVRDPLGQATTLGYDANGRLSSIRDPMGRTTVVEHTGALLTRIADPDGVTAFQATYDAQYRIKQRSGRGGATSGYAYDGYGKVAADTLPAVVTDAGTVRPVIRYTSREVAAEELLYIDVSNYPGVQYWPDLTTHAWAAVTDPRGHVTRVEVDRFGAPLAVNDGFAITRTSRWDSGLPYMVTAPSRINETFVWDFRTGQLTRWYSGGDSVRIEYDSVYAQPVRTVQNGVVTTNRLSYLGEVLSSKVGSDSTVFTYDSRGRVLTATDPQLHRTTYAYHPSGQQNLHWVQQNNADGSTRTTTFAYDAYGRRNATVDPYARTSAVAYDLVNRPLEEVNPAQDTTRYTWSGPFLHQVRDAAGKVYTYNRNVLGWLVSQVEPDGTGSSFVHDRNGNVVRAVNRRGQVITFGYDALNQMTSRTADGATTTYSYDNVARTWVAAQNAESIDTLRFNNRGWVWSEITVRNGRRYHLSSGHGPYGQRTSLSVNAPFSRLVIFGYHPSLLPSFITGFDNTSTTFGYNTDYQLNRITYPTGLQQTLAYTPTHQVSSASWNVAAVNQATYPGLRYDYLDRVNQLTDPWGMHKSYGYDNRGNLSAYTEGPVTFYLTYDRVGNRTDNGAALQPNSNRYATFGGYSFEYDADGNVTRKYNGSGWSQTFEWNTLGQLVAVTTPSVGRVTYGYDAWGRRVRRSGGARGEARYVYDGDDLMFDLTPVAGGESVYLEYTHFEGIDRPHSVRYNGSTYYFVSERPGNVSALVNAANQIQSRYTYKPFGATTSSSEAVPNALRWMGREMDVETGLYYFRNRWYDPQAARFVSEDPIGLAGGMNTYAFAGNDPVNSRDPLGLFEDAGDGCNWVQTEAGDPDGTQLGPHGKYYKRECPILLDPITVTAPPQFRHAPVYYPQMHPDYSSAFDTDHGRGGWGVTGDLPNRFHYTPEQKECQAESAERFVDVGLLVGGGALLRGGKVAWRSYRAGTLGQTFTAVGAYRAYTGVDDWRDTFAVCRIAESQPRTIGW